MQARYGGLLFLIGFVFGLFIAFYVLSKNDIIDSGFSSVIFTEPKPKSQRNDTRNYLRSPLLTDERLHSDNRSEANRLARTVRVQIWVMTSDSTLSTRAAAVRDTWARHADPPVIYMSENDNDDFPATGLYTKPGRDHLTAKTIAAFDHLYKRHLHAADWFMKTDDDSFVIVENLRYFLGGQDPTQPVYFGHHFKPLMRQGYFSGGGGYVLSQEALRRFGEREPGRCRDDGGAEDVEMGRCMQVLGVRTGDSRDALNRSRFHCFDPQTHIHGGYPKWYYQYDKHGARQGADSISDHAISFHYVNEKLMHELDFYIYHLRPYGINSGSQNLNAATKSNIHEANRNAATKTNKNNTATKNSKKHS